jgi:hypothetical protein
MDDHLLEIINDIRDENCVLIIGSDMYDFENKSFFEVMCEDFLKEAQYKEIFDNDSQYVFLNEELLQLKPGTNEYTVLKMMQRFYQKQTVFDEPLKKISLIPYHLIISLMPDDRLQRIFTEQKLAFNYGYYPTEEVFKPITEKPSREKPLIYNLLGDFKEKDAVITFDNMFSYLSNIMGKKGLPQVIEESLKKASTFIFLGVHFERWHVQLLLKLITYKKRVNYSILKNGNDNDVCLFVGRRLELELLKNDPIDFLNLIYENCLKQNILKRIPCVAKVFISYSHTDALIVQAIIPILISNNIDVVIDESNMSGGQKINDFIRTIEKVDIVIPIISKNSLYSPWVIKEMDTTLKYGKKLLPCTLDKTLFDKNLNADALKLARDQIKEIIEKISILEIGNIDDLVAERNMWNEYNNQFPTVINKLKEIKCRTIDNKELVESVAFILKDINLMTKESDDR